MNSIDGDAARLTITMNQLSRIGLNVNSVSGPEHCAAECRSCFMSLTELRGCEGKATEGVNPDPRASDLLSWNSCLPRRCALRVQANVLGGAVGAGSCNAQGACTNSTGGVGAGSCVGGNACYFGRGNNWH